MSLENTATQRIILGFLWLLLNLSLWNFAFANAPPIPSPDNPGFAPPDRESPNFLPAPDNPDSVPDTTKPPITIQNSDLTSDEKRRLQRFSQDVLKRKVIFKEPE